MESKIMLSTNLTRGNLVRTISKFRLAKMYILHITSFFFFFIYKLININISGMIDYLPYIFCKNINDFKILFVCNYIMLILVS